MDTVDRRVYYTLCRDTGLAKSQAGAVKKKKKLARITVTDSPNQSLWFADSVSLISQTGNDCRSADTHMFTCESIALFPSPNLI